MPTPGLFSCAVPCLLLVAAEKPVVGADGAAAAAPVEEPSVEAVCESLLLVLAVSQTVALTSTDGDVLQVRLGSYPQRRS